MAEPLDPYIQERIAITRRMHKLDAVAEQTAVPRDMRPVCLGCGERYDRTGYRQIYCTPRCRKIHDGKASAVGQKRYDYDAILRALDAGLSPSHVAREFGCDRGTVYKAKRRNGGSE